MVGLMPQYFSSSGLGFVDELIKICPNNTLFAADNRRPYGPSSSFWPVAYDNASAAGASQSATASRTHRDTPDLRNVAPISGLEANWPGYSVWQDTPLVAVTFTHWYTASSVVDEKPSDFNIAGCSLFNVVKAALHLQMSATCVAERENAA